MRRADTPDGLYVVGNPVTGEKGTRTGEFYNDVQEEICNVIEAAGGALDPAKRDQLSTAIAKLGGRAVSRIVTESGPVLLTDVTLLIDATGGPVNLALLSAADAHHSITLIRIDDSGNAVVFTPTAGTVCRAALLELVSQDEYICLTPNPSDNNWYRIG